VAVFAALLFKQTLTRTATTTAMKIRTPSTTPMMTATFDPAM